MRVLGIDPGSYTTGYGLVEFEGGILRHIDNGGIHPPKDLPIARRLHCIYAELARLIQTQRPEVVAIEDLFIAKNARSSLMLGHARAAAMLAAAAAGLEVAEYSPSEVKQSVVGQGRASKEQVQKMVRVILSLPEAAFEDASDALAVAICHCQSSAFARRVGESLERLSMRRP